MFKFISKKVVFVAVALLVLALDNPATRVNQLPNAKDALNRADQLLLSDEFAQGLGDGAVSLRSAALPGVSEFITVPINHGQWAQTDKTQVQQLVQRTAELLCRNREPAFAKPIGPQRAKF